MSALGNRDNFDQTPSEEIDTDTRIRIESLRFLRENEPEQFEMLKEDLVGTDIWQRFQKEYG